MMSENMINPYISNGNWYKGNLHLHTDQSDGELSVKEAIDGYVEDGYDFLAITDHDYIAIAEEFIKIPDKFIIIPGYEFSKREHMVCINTLSVTDSDHQTVVNEANKSGGMCIFSHPNWLSEDYWSVERMASMTGVLGMEIYNHHIAHLEGSPAAFKEWDELLSKGHRLWGFAADDTHRKIDLGKAWIMVKTTGLNKDSLLMALRKGSFYASTGPSFEKLELNSSGITVSGSKPGVFEFIGENGKLLDRRQNCPTAVYMPDKSSAYVRIQYEVENLGVAWSQPFFING